MSSPILFERPRTSLALVTLNRPERFNALSGEMLREFLKTLDAIAAGPGHRVLLIRGNGKGFCSGIDLQECSTSEEAAEEMFRHVTEIILKIRRLPGLVVSSVHGGAYGGGSAIVAASDLALCSEGTKFGTTETRLGFDPVLLFPLFRRKLTEAPLKELLLAGRSIDAHRARDIGLVQYVVEETEREDFTRDLIRDVLRTEKNATQNAKWMLQANENTIYGISFEEELTLSLQAHLESWRTLEAYEGVRAFLEKRNPSWREEDSPESPT